MENQKIRNKEKHEIYMYYKKHHICVRCMRKDSEPNTVQCIECNEKSRKNFKRYYEQHKDEQDKKTKECHKRLYYERKAKGICTKCGKHKIYSKSNIYCMDCYIKQRRIDEDSRNRRKSCPISRSERPAYGFCYKCGKHELYSDKLCQDCHEKQSKVMKKINENPTQAMLDNRERYKNYNKIFFQKRRASNE